MSNSELLLFSGISASWGLIIFGNKRGNSDKAIIQMAKAEGGHRIVEIDGNNIMLSENLR